MGDYTKVIVNCSIKKMSDSEIIPFTDLLRSKMGITSSAYHCGGEIIKVDNSWDHRTDVSMITQNKYGRDVFSFIEWLRPLVVEGSGQDDVYCMTFSEYCSKPTLYSLSDSDEA